MRKMKELITMLFAIGLMAGAASAQEVVIQPIATAYVKHDSSFLQFEPRWIDGSGLVDATIVETGDPVPAVWPEHISGYNAQRVERLRNVAEFETLTFNLGGIFEITGMALWNSTESGSPDRGFEHTALSYSTDGGATFTSGDTLTWLERAADVAPNQGDNPPTNAATYAPEFQTLPASSGPGVTHVRMVVDNFSTTSITMAQELRFTGIPAAEAFYVAAAPTDWTDSDAWSDSNPAMAGTQYYAANSNVVLETPATTATFPGEFLTLESAQRLELMATSSDVITIDPLNIDGGVVAAGVVDSGEAKLDGTILLLSGTSFLGATNGTTRDLRILAEINSVGGVPVQLDAPGQTIYIDNTNNTVAGIWNINEDTTAEFAGDGAVGLGSIQVQSNATLRINDDWDGLSTSESLTVVDSPSGLVELGTYSWTVNTLQVSGSNVLTGFTYDVAQLNAIGPNPMFTGTGTIQVGDPYIAPPPPATYYLQANVPANKWIGEQEYWYDAPTGGNQMPYYAIFAGSTFDVNGFAWRAQNTGGISVFDGHLVVNETTGSDIYLAYAADQQLVGGMSVSNSVTFRPHRTTASGGSGTTISDLETGPSGRLWLRALINGGNEYFIQRLAIGEVSGTGEIRFGGTGDIDTNGVWSLTVTDISTNFSGVVRLSDGELTFDNSVQLPNAEFVVGTAAGDANTIVLANDVAFGSMRFDSTMLTNGIYTADDLNTEFATDRFSGSESVYIGMLIPKDFAAWAEDMGLTGDDALPGTDVEPDGMDNLLEYALGGNPTNDDANVYLPKYSIVDVSGTKWVEYVYNRWQDADARGLDYDVILRDNLVIGSWNNIGQTAETSSGPVDEDYESVTNQIPTDAAVTFTDLKVTEN